MKANCFKYVLIIIIIYSSLQKVKTQKIKHEKSQSEINKGKTFRFCGADQIKNEILKEENFNPGEIVNKNKNKRYLEREEEYKQIRIFLDTTHINDQGVNNMVSKVIVAMEKCVKTLEKLLKVIPKKNNIKVTLNEANISFNIKKINSTLENEGIPADLIIFSRIANYNELGNALANAGAKKLDSNTFRPYIGVVNINPEIEFSLGNSINYLESIYYMNLHIYWVFHIVYLIIFQEV